MIDVAKSIVGRIATAIAMVGSGGSVLIRPVERTPSELSAGLSKCLSGGYSKMEWACFITQPIKNRSLEAIRLRALPVELPLADEGRAMLTQLMAELEAMEAQSQV